MHTIILTNIAPVQAMLFKDQLVQDGLIMHKDFEWKYYPSLTDGFTTERPRRAEFMFHDDALATFYQLKWLR
jgi:hypothetical protein